jgi:hypothetical protein
MDDAVEWWMMLHLLNNLMYDGANNHAITERVLLARTTRGDMTKEAIHSIDQCCVPQGHAITCLVYMHRDFTRFISLFVDEPLNSPFLPSRVHGLMNILHLFLSMNIRKRIPRAMTYAIEVLSSSSSSLLSSSSATTASSHLTKDGSGYMMSNVLKKEMNAYASDVTARKRTTLSQVVRLDDQQQQGNPLCRDPEKGQG